MVLKALFGSYTQSPKFDLMRRLFFLFVCCFPLLLTNCGGGKSAVKTSNKRGVQFVKSNALMDVMDKANKSNKLIFVDLYTTWCLPCKIMDEEVFTDKDLSTFMNKNFINYKVDAEKDNGPSLVFHFGASTYPLLLFLDEKGNILERKDGSASHSELRNMANRALNARAGN